MNAHSRPIRIATIEGIYVLDPSTGFYEPEREEKWPLWKGLIPAVLAGLALAYLLYLAAQAWLG